MHVDDIRLVACVGAGTIGFSWAALFAQHGLHVNVYDISEEVLNQAGVELKNALGTLVGAGVMGEAEVEAALARIATTTDLAEAVRDADYVQESAPEKYRIKRETYRALDDLCRPEVILASSSSGLLMTEIQKATARPERCVVAHPWNPPHIVPLVEIVPGSATSTETVELVRAFMAALGKEPVVLSKEVGGYIGNRLQSALLREAVWLVGNGIASVAEVDLAARTGPGLRLALMGPFMMLTLSGPGGLEDVLIKGKYLAEEEILSRVEAESLPPTPESELEWAKRCVAQMQAELEGVDMEEVKKWRDAKLLQVLEALASDSSGVVTGWNRFWR
jgi:3-hydroxypropionate dehydrogenase (NADP+)